MHPTYRCACQGIDVHAHIVPAEFPRYLGARVPREWPSMREAHACHRHVVIDEKIYRTVSDLCWDTQKRLADMDTQNVAIQAISPMPELLSYWMEAPDALPLLHYLNDTIAQMADASAGRMVGLGAVPLQNVDMAIRELERLMATPGFAGVEIGSNINGAPIGAAQFDAFFEAAAALGAAVFVHALRPAGKERLVGPAQLVQALAFPTDVGLAAASAITSSLIIRYPNLRIAFSHGGGTLASLLPRLEQASRVFAPVRETLQQSAREQARGLWYDSLVFDPATLRHLVESFGDTRIMLGTDYPFAFRERDPVGGVEALGLDAAAAERLIYRNAREFLGIRNGG
ncbi:aminocarboxymuconate-semialdehyde decarboxylase [Paraburkholderia tropica]|uniref:2-amino-3-carboxymuconate-6-semialdehyde decarboxylase n=1 Tax=Paraburkholderia tropica TaxID=92647 RepID=A0ABX5MGQ2_9BURK|nr:amidohydrolase family protein [Paraburkholderia tropica]MBB3004673.1 aminocarboxymuconate-semialdehyde decarboxylase [Paraburkholderia tropica]MBB6323471.1 aminocarboxymuconate-semialdehyde decarboxylase [Paraburkholderia tropica]PXX03466.1 aminocarboxymuconate-semialdehyde decarboxylase [Paraburkholderia tropica]PZW69385.1 aminocarboxymuconate-semialdehyde decarboxylase [Paraburkholderia tropica]